MTIELVDFATMTAELRPPMVLSGTPAGDRMIFEVESGRLEGNRIRATLKGRAAAGWLTVGPDGTGALDVRALVETDDGALVFIQYNGRYRWLNRVQAAGKGTFDGRTLRYELYEVH
jgi:Protein of unknown function (DUF3237)